MSDEFEAKAKEVYENVERTRGVFHTNKINLVRAYAQALREVSFERDEYKKAAESWMKDCDALKAKYEPLIGVTSAQPKYPSDEETRIAAETSLYVRHLSGPFPVKDKKSCWLAGAHWAIGKMKGK